MALTGNGSSAYLLAAAISPPATYSWHIFYRNASTPGTGSDTRPFSLDNFTPTYDAGFLWHNSLTPKTVFNRRANNTYDFATIASALSANTWYGIGGRLDGSNNLTAWLDGVISATTASGAPVNNVNPEPNFLAAFSGTQKFDAGSIAEAGVWNVPLTDAEHAALGKGVCPLRVRPQSLKVYFPLVRDTVPRFGAINSTSGLAFATHPRIYRGRGVDGDFAIQQPALSGSFSDSLSFIDTETLDDPEEGFSSSVRFLDGYGIGAIAISLINPGVTFTGTFTADAELVVLTGEYSDSFRIRSKISANSGDLASGRYRG